MDTFAWRVYLSRVRDFVEGAQFPATKAEVLAHARRRNTPSEIFNDLTRLKADRFESLDELLRAVEALHQTAAMR